MDVKTATRQAEGNGKPGQESVNVKRNNTRSAPPRQAQSPGATPNPAAMAETELTAALIVQGGTVLDQVKDIIRPADFYLKKHRLIWESACDLHEKGLSVDLVGIATRLQENGQLDEVGAGFLSKTADDAPLSMNPAGHARAIKRAAAARQLFLVGKSISSCVSNGAPQEKLLALLDQAEPVFQAVRDSTKDPAPKIEIISLSEITNINPTIESIVDGFLIRKAGHILHAAGGVGKSTIAGQIAGELAKDQPSFPRDLFDTFPILLHRIQSLFLQSENSMATINTKLKWLRGDPAADRIFFPKLFDDVICTGEAFTDDAFIQKVADTIHLIEDKTGHRLDIVWVDPLISFHKGDENAADHMRAALDGVTKLMQMTNTTAVVLHHDNRQGEIRGSGAIDQWARSRMQMKQVWIGEDRIRDMGPDGPVKTVAKVPAVELHHKKANDMPLFDKITLAQDRSLMFRLVPDPVDQETATRATEVVKALQDMGGVCDSNRELCRAVSELTGRSESTCRKDISDAVTLGNIERIPNKKGNVNAYGYQIKA